MKNFEDLTPEEKIPLLKQYMEYWCDNYVAQDVEIEHLHLTLVSTGALMLMSFSLWYAVSVQQADFDTIYHIPDFHIKFAE